MAVPEVEGRTVMSQPETLPGAELVAVADDLLACDGAYRGPSDIMIQVLRRPSDPICDRLEENLLLWGIAGFAIQPLKDPFGGWIDVARNWQSILFQRSEKFRYLLMIDADVGPPLALPRLLARHGKPIVSGIVCAHSRQRGVFACIAVDGADGKAHFPTIAHTKTLPARGLVEIRNAGTGCLLVHRTVMDRLWQTYREQKAEEGLCREVDMLILEGSANGSKVELTDPMRTAVRNRIRRANYVDDISGPPFSIPQSVRDKAAEIGSMVRGEDIMFTDRALAAGFTIYADFEAQCFHEKTMRLAWPDERIDPSLTVEDWKRSAFDMPVAQE